MDSYLVSIFKKLSLYHASNQLISKGSIPHEERYKNTEKQPLVCAGVQGVLESCQSRRNTEHSGTTVSTVSTQEQQSTGGI